RLTLSCERRLASSTLNGDSAIFFVRGVHANLDPGLRRDDVLEQSRSVSLPLLSRPSLPPLAVMTPGEGRDNATGIVPPKFVAYH
ncbi:hypothetical protein, partial [Massilia sp. ZL223]|uniref:hypothetical protein n=1 Tax=Massilia sp. ZL223 TaxID=2824904 RepID=UPI001B8101F4